VSLGPECPLSASGFRANLQFECSLMFHSRHYANCTAAPDRKVWPLRVSFRNRPCAPLTDPAVQDHFAPNLAVLRWWQQLRSRRTGNGPDRPLREMSVAIRNSECATQNSSTSDLKLPTDRHVFQHVGAQRTRARGGAMRSAGTARAASRRQTPTCTEDHQLRGAAVAIALWNRFSQTDRVCISAYLLLSI
jgi:hypothetical protein